MCSTRSAWPLISQRTRLADLDKVFLMSTCWAPCQTGKQIIRQLPLKQPHSFCGSAAGCFYFFNIVSEADGKKYTKELRFCFCSE